MFGPEPVARVPSPDDAVALDDDFLSGNPMAYFESRIQGLLAVVQGAGRVADGVAAEYAALLGGVPTEGASESDRMLQVALDSFSLRHHAAETLLRFVVAVADCQEAKGGTTCLWFHATEGSPQIEALLTRYRALVAEEDASRRLFGMFLPTPVKLASPADRSRLEQATDVMAAWLERALFLLQRDDLNLNGVANKIKHGLTARARDDLRLDAIQATPGQAFDARASVLNGPTAVRLFDAIAVETIGRASRAEALEHTVLMLRPAHLLAEAHMIARLHASAFHIAAVKHLGDRAAFEPPPYPALALGPLPEHVHRGAVVGSRRPVTFRKDGSRTERRRGYATEQFFVGITITGNARSGTVSDG